MRGGGSTNRSAHRGGQPPNRGEVGYPARGPSHHARGGGGGSNGRNISPYNKPEPWSRDANKSETWSRDTSSGGPPPSNRGQPRGKFSSARGGAPALKRDIGFRGLGNKEEIPHNLKPIDWQSIAMEEVHKVQYNVRLPFQCDVFHINETFFVFLFRSRIFLEKIYNKGIYVKTKNSLFSFLFSFLFRNKQETN